MARTAEVKRDARIGEAEAKRDAQIKEAIAEEERMAARYEPYCVTTVQHRSKCGFNSLRGLALTQSIRTWLIQIILYSKDHKHKNCHAGF